MDTEDRMVAKDGQLTVLESAKGITLAAARAELDETSSHAWQGVDEAAKDPAFGLRVEREFPEHASEWVDPVSRRGFMKLMGASLTMAGLAGCTKQPDEPIYPYIKQPEDLILGQPNYFATAFPFPTGALPLLVKSDAYRPIKIDGNPEHPMSKGGSDPLSQGSLLGLYDPDRSQRILYHLETTAWADFQKAVQRDTSKLNGGQGLYILSATITSPTLAAQWKDVQKRFPQARLVQYEPVNRDAARRASKAAFGDFYDAQYMLANADVVVSLDSDFLSGIRQPGFNKLANDFIGRRKLMDKSVEMNRLYAVESTPRTTGFKADHRLKLRASQVGAFSRALAQALGAPGGGGAQPNWTGEQQQYLQAVVADLKAHGGKSVVIPGEDQTPDVHLAAIAINQALGNVGKTVVYTEAIDPLPSIQTDDLKSLVADMNAGKVQWLLMLNVNPVYSAPADLKFLEALGKVPTSVHLGDYVDETAQYATWHVNGTHYLENWSDARAYDGTLSVVQPMIEPLYAGKSAHDIVQLLTDNPQRSPFAAVQATWQPVLKGDFESAWRKVLHDGFAANTAFPAKSLNANTSALSAAAAPVVSDDQIELIFRPDPSIYDGRFANIGWLQELPKPLINNSWDNAVLMSGPTKTKLGVEEGDVIEIALNGATVRGPVLSVPGHPDNSFTLHLGYGRQHAGRVGSGMGFNAFPLRTSNAPSVVTGAQVKKTGETYEVAVTKSHYSDERGERARAGTGFSGGDMRSHSLEGDEAITRGIVRSTTLEEFRKEPNFAQEEGVAPESPDRSTTMFPNWTYEHNAWGMAIDQNSCIGCNACIVSCYAENNIAVVGKHNVKTGRDMQWIRIDTYFEGDLQAPRAHFQPMTCQHCENAPCEQVCPVAATVHTPEGLNTMVYNRCVGTRYCSNNCPYKVRRFNFLLFSDYETESLKLMRNPDVSVRSRGVMEKCTYCVQRIMAARIEADKENRNIRDGEIVTACQQACPTEAIVFGNINDPNAKVSKIKAQSRNYSVLADLNTRPRTTYIAEVTNPNPALTPEAVEHAPERS